MCLISKVTGCNLTSGEELQHNIMLLIIKTTTIIIIIVIIIILMLIIDSDKI